MKRVYFASKMCHGEIKVNHKDVDIYVNSHARWYKDQYHKTEVKPQNIIKFWRETITNIKRSDAVIIYAEPEEILRDSLIEVSIASDLNIPVFVIGDHKKYGRWQYHNDIYFYGTLEQALKGIKAMKCE